MPGSSEPFSPAGEGDSEEEPGGDAVGVLRESTAQMFRALGHPARLWIIELLGHRKCSVSELAQETGLPADTMSKHLRALAAVNIVRRSQAGNFAQYSLRQSASYRLVGLAHSMVTSEIKRLQSVAYLARQSAVQQTSLCDGQAADHPLETVR
jgi:DNA-binding transcriptional ArsR family regulator